MLRLHLECGKVLSLVPRFYNGRDRVTNHDAPASGVAALCELEITSAGVKVYFSVAKDPSAAASSAIPFHLCSPSLALTRRRPSFSHTERAAVTITADHLTRRVPHSQSRDASHDAASRRPAGRRQGYSIRRVRVATGLGLLDTARPEGPSVTRDSIFFSSLPFSRFAKKHRKRYRLFQQTED